MTRLFPNDLSNMVVMYGVAPMPESPRYPEPAPLLPLAPLISWPLEVAAPLVPCVKCSRHVRMGGDCPFCYADEVAVRASEAATGERGGLRRQIASLNAKLTEVSKERDEAERQRDDARSVLDLTLERMKRAAALLTGGGS